MNRINLKAGEFEFPHIMRIGPTYVESRAMIIETEDIDFDVLCTFYYSDSIGFANAVPLLDSFGQSVTLLIPASNKKAGIDIDNFHGRYLYMRFTQPEGIVEATSSAHQSANITQMTADIQFTVDANGAETKVSVEYGKTNLYGSLKELPLVTVPAAQEAFAVLTTLEDLEPDTTYHWRVRMTNDVGVSDGADQTFKTLSVALPGIVDEASDNLTANSAGLSFNIHPGGADTEVVVQYGDSALYGDGENLDPIPAGVAEIPCTIPLVGLNPATTYHWRVVATNSAGVEEGVDQTFLTADAAPSIADEASVPTAANCAVSGTVNSNGDETVVTIEWGLTNAYGEAPVAAAESPVLAGNVAVPITATIPGLVAETTYHWRIKAVNAVGTTYSPDQTFITPA